MSTPHNIHMQPKVINIKSIPGLADVNYFEVNSPAFLDHALDERAVCAKIFTFGDLEQFLRTTRPVYVLSCTQTVEQERDGTVVVRFAVGTEGKLAPLAEVTTQDTRITSDLRPVVPATIEVATERVADLIAFWGRDEAVRQLGEYILMAIEAANHLIARKSK